MFITKLNLTGRASVKILVSLDMELDGHILKAVRWEAVTVQSHARLDSKFPQTQRFHFRDVETRSRSDGNHARLGKTGNHPIAKTRRCVDFLPLSIGTGLTVAAEASSPPSTDPDMKAILPVQSQCNHSRTLMAARVSSGMRVHDRTCAHTKPVCGLLQQPVITGPLRGFLL